MQYTIVDQANTAVYSFPLEDGVLVQAFALGGQIGSFTGGVPAGVGFTGGGFKTLDANDRVMMTFDVAEGAHVEYFINGWNRIADFVAHNVATPPPPTGGGGGSITLPDLNPSPAGTFGDSAHVAAVTVNAKGLVTHAEDVAIAYPTGGGAGVSGGLFNPASLAQFETVIQAALDGGYTVPCDGRGQVVFDRGLHFTVRDQGQQVHGAIGNGMKLVNNIAGAPTDMIQIELPADQFQNRHLRFGGFGFQGYGPTNNNAHGLRFVCNGGGWYELVVEGNNFEGCADCLAIEGNIFEFIVAPQVYINSDRCFYGTNPGGQNVKVLSNALIDWATYKQCRIGIQLAVANSVICRGGSFVDITERSLLASNGIKNFDNGHFENGGAGHAIEMDGQDWPGTLTNCTLSNTRGGNPYICKYLGPAGNLKAGFNRIHVGTAVFTPDSTVPANFTSL